MTTDLARVEAELVRAVQAADPFLTGVTSHLIPAGGKRLRPALALAVGALAGQPVSDDVVMGAVAVELVHLGSLYHDDVIDAATTRRTVESVNARWGNLVAILAGDFLLARASEIAAALGTEVAGLLAATIGRLCEGQVRELSQAFDAGRTEESYLTSIGGKTAALMSTACRIGAITAGISRAGTDASTEYGQQIGMVFQIIDDVLDVVATPEELGKPAGNDIADGVYTLPVIRALSGPSPVAEPLRALLGRPLQGDELDQARRLVLEDGAVASAIDVARRYAGEAAASLTTLDSSAAPDVQKALACLGDHLIETVAR